MKTQEFMALLDRLSACDEAKEWAEGKDFAEVYATCHRGDWLAWLYENTNPDDKRKLVLLGGLFANEVRHLMKDERSIAAVDVCLRYGRGEATDDELTAAWDAAGDAAGDALDAEWAAGAAWAAAGAAAEAAAWAAAWDAAGDAAMAVSFQRSADIFRENVRIEDFNLNS